ncbi:polyribonucleotide nucleotidyltransferase [Trifolium pratense]|uniref:Polyribonucleotide nucleotidyltransferase n=1 Tax=Trifolium pratense TaxID=57577 RepID=A0A2K3LPA4_TRIPR|nr:polyribonucleotide nucleotidyltransferase [Trifolium pratense]PNX80368.1 polyribonucleotide nucleotidyltransferase [Trifolium pratense]
MAGNYLTYIFPGFQGSQSWTAARSSRPSHRSVRSYVLRPAKRAGPKFECENGLGLSETGQINEKGQLRLSYRAMLPDADSDSSNSSDEGSSEEVTSLTNAGLVEDKVKTPKGTASSKRSSEDNSVLPSKKFIRRSVSPSQEKPISNKDKIKKSGNKAVSSVSSKDENSLVGDEA